MGGHFVILGDFNCEHDAPELHPLLKDKKLFNVFENLDKGERWSYLHAVIDKNNIDNVKTAEVSQFDYIFLSPTIMNGNPDIKPDVERRGVVYYPAITEKLKKNDEELPVFMITKPLDFQVLRNMAVKYPITAAYL